MQKKAKITGNQLILMLLITRLLFSSCKIPAINPGSSIPDILPAIAVNLFSNLIFAVPALMLLRRHPGRDLTDCSIQILGPVAGGFTALLYGLFFLTMAALYLGIYECFFRSCIITDASPLSIVLPMVIVSVYAVIEGIEPIARFGLLTFVFYILISVIIYATILPGAQLQNLMPMFYNGFGYFKDASVANFIMSPQILLLAMLTPALRKQDNIVRIFVVWDIVAMLLFAALDFFLVICLGSFASNQMFPLGTLGTFSSIGSFQRLDVFDMIAWTLNTLLSVTLYLYAAAACLQHVVLKKHRRIAVVLLGALMIPPGMFVGSQYLKHIGLYTSGTAALVVLILTFVLPLVILLADIIKGKVAEYVQADGSAAN